MMYIATTTQGNRRQQTSSPAQPGEFREYFTVACVSICAIIWKHDVIHKTGST